MTHALEAARPKGPTCTQLDRERIQAVAAQMADRERWPHERLLEYQRDRLRGILQHAVANSPYYREVIGDPGNGEIELQELPILTKATLMAEFDRIVTDRRLRLANAEQHLASERAGEPLFGEYRVVGSGGTTGQRGLAVYDQAAWEVCRRQPPARDGDSGDPCGDPRPWHRGAYASSHIEPPVRRASCWAHRCSAPGRDHAASRSG